MKLFHITQFFVGEYSRPGFYVDLDHVLGIKSLSETLTKPGYELLRDRFPLSLASERSKFGDRRCLVNGSFYAHFELYLAFRNDVVKLHINGNNDGLLSEMMKADKVGLHSPYRVDTEVTNHEEYRLEYEAFEQRFLKADLTNQLVVNHRLAVEEYQRLVEAWKNTA